MTATLGLAVSAALLIGWAGWYVLRLGKRLKEADSLDDQVDKMTERDEAWKEAEREREDLDITSADDIDSVFDKLRKRRAKKD